MEPRTLSDSVIVAASPEAVYDLVTDIGRTGEWSPICRLCWWHDDDGARPGAWFTGRNESHGRVWETESRVEVAERGRKFAWLVGGSYVQWSYTFVPVAGGTRLTEHWEFLPDGIAMFHDKYGDRAEAQIEERTRAARDGIPTTLASIRAIAEREKR